MVREAQNLCAKTACTASSGTLTMEFCLDCSGAGGPYALCNNGALANLSTFDGIPQGDDFIEVLFTFSSTTPVLTQIDLWYQAGDRKYLPLLKPGDGAGSYKKVFAPINACLGHENAFSTAGQVCSGSHVGKECPACGAMDSCGEFDAGCSGVDFSAAKLQVAAEFCPSGVDRFQGRLDVTAVNLISMGCLQTAP